MNSDIFWPCQLLDEHAAAALFSITSSAAMPQLWPERRQASPETSQHKEFDIVVVNGSEVVAVEVKTTLTPDKVSYFLSAMEQFKRYFPDYRHRRVYGAVAYLRSEAEAKRYAEKQGLFVIRATGDSASIVNTEDFRPKEFPTEGAA